MVKQKPIMFTHNIYNDSRIALHIIPNIKVYISVVLYFTCTRTFYLKEIILNF